MSNDLISRKALMKIFLETIDGRRMPEYDCDGFPITLSLSEIKKFIRQAPTAYDVDAVCLELPRHARPYGTVGCSCEYAIPKDTAIEIVRNGGKKE